MKIAKQLILPVILILVFSIYLGVKNTGKVNYELPVFQKIEKNNFQAIEIVNGDTTINLYSENGVWKFSSDKKRVNTGEIEKILEFLGSPQLIDMVSESKNYQNFGLEDGKYITVRAYKDIKKKGNPDREFFIGNLSSNRNFTYLRSSDNPNVFTAGSSIRSLFETNKDKLMDKRIVGIDTTIIDKINFSTNGKTEIFSKSVGEDSKDLWVSESGIKIDTTKLEQGIRYLSNSKLESYTNSTVTDNEHKIASIVLSGKDTEENFSILKKVEKGYLCSSSFTDSNFIVSENTGTQIIKMFKDVIDTE